MRVIPHLENFQTRLSSLEISLKVVDVTVGVNSLFDAVAIHCSGKFTSVELRDGTVNVNISILWL